MNAWNHGLILLAALVLREFLPGSISIENKFQAS